MFLYVDRLRACMIHKCVHCAAIKIITSGSLVVLKKSWSTAIPKKMIPRCKENIYWLRF